MQYRVSSRAGRHFEIANERGQPVGTMLANLWQPGKAQINTADGNIYDIAGTGFWQVKKAISKNGMPYAELRPRATLGYTLTFENGAVLNIQKKSARTTGDYTVTDEMKGLIATIRSTFKWSVMGFQYDIETAITDTELSHLLPFILIYCVRYTRMRSAG